MAAFEVTTRDEAAGLDAELSVEGMRGIAVFDGEAGEQTASSLPCRGGFLLCISSHGLKLSILRPVIHFDIGNRLLV